MTSIVITTCNRPKQLKATLESIAQQMYKNLEIVVVDDGFDEETPSICSAHNVQYVKMNRPWTGWFRNPSRPNNVGIRRTKGDIIILQNAECKHVDSNTIEKLANAVTDTNVVFTRVSALNPDGTFMRLYCGKEFPHPYFFCGAIKRAWFEKLRGFDEDYTGSSYDDDDFAVRLQKEGVTFVFSEIEVHHQWHGDAGAYNSKPMEELYKQKCAAMEAGTLGTVRNLNREWGVLCV